jgi:stage II sporulation protein D
MSTPSDRTLEILSTPMRAWSKYVVVLFTIVWTAGPCKAGDRIAVGLFHGANYVRATITAHDHGFELWADNNLLIHLKAGQQLEVSSISGSLNVYFNQHTTTAIKKLTFKPTNESASLHIQPVGAKTNRRKYGQEMDVIPYAGRLQFINLLQVEEYVAGVIEAETGSNQTTEFYKVQAVISRTYAINNLQKHKAEGFHMCDAVHCQVYHGLPLHEPKTYEAAFATRDLVIVDHHIEMIDATFHSNCGGRTYKANEVWTKDVPHLQSMDDPHCNQMPHSYWKKTISKTEWDQFIYNQRNPLRADSDSASYAAAMLKPQYVVDSTLSISRVDMREAFKLKSVKFDVTMSDDSVRFNGRGFGHGVGLCQEGAMARANEGMRYQEIIHAYYRDVHLIPRYMLWFFKDEESNGD